MRLFKLWFPVFAWAAFIFFLSGIPHLKTNLSCDLVLRKIAHVTEYFILTLFLHNAFKNTFTLNAASLFVYSSCIAVFYAISDETHQLFVAGRNGSPKDVLIDAVGIFGFYAALRFLGRRVRKAI